MLLSSSMYKRQPITLMAHVPEMYNGYTDRLFEQLYRFLEHFSIECPIERERWEGTSDKHAHTALAYFTNSDSDDSRSIKLNGISQDIQCLLVVVKFTGLSFLSNMRIFSTINKSDLYTIPIQAKERTTRIDIPYEIWEKVDSAHIVGHFIEFCNHIGATYGCADVGLLSQTNIYNGAFYLFAKDAQKIDFENSLPGIHWGQYVNIRRIKNTIQDIAEIQKEIDFASTIVIDSENIWIQLNEDEIDVPSQKIRQEFSCYFNASLPDIDEQKIVQCKIPHIKRCLPLMIPHNNN